MIDLLTRYAPAFAQGVGTTILIAVIVWAVGIGLGVVIGAAASRRGSLSLGFLRSAGLVVGAIPVLVILMWLHYPAQALLRVVIDPFITTVVALSLVNAVFVADAVSRTISGLPEEWTLAARAAGLSKETTTRRITLPLAVRQLVGPVLVIQITMLHATLFASLISVGELFRTIQRINAIEYQPVELCSFLALFFLVICVPLHLFANALSKKFATDLVVR